MAWPRRHVARRVCAARESVRRLVACARTHRFTVLRDYARRCVDRHAEASRHGSRFARRVRLLRSAHHAHCDVFGAARRCPDADARRDSRRGGAVRPLHAARRIPVRASTRSSARFLIAALAADRPIARLGERARSRRPHRARAAADALAALTFQIAFNECEPDRPVRRSPGISRRRARSCILNRRSCNSSCPMTISFSLEKIV